MIADAYDDLAEAKRRVRNLMWTVSGDYTLDTKLDVGSYEESKYISLYDAVRQGAFARFFDKDAFGLYLVKKIYCGADERSLTELAQLCVDAASFPLAARERPGIPELREKAFSDLLEHSFHKMSASLAGRMKIAWMRYCLDGDDGGEKQIRESIQMLQSLEHFQKKQAQEMLDQGKYVQREQALEALDQEKHIQREQAQEALDQGKYIQREQALEALDQEKHTQREQAHHREKRETETAEIIRTVDALYNALIDKSFVRRHGDLAQVLSVTLEDLKEFDWNDFLEEELSEEDFDAYLNQVSQAAQTMQEESDRDAKQPRKAKKKIIQIDEKAAAKMYTYMELNFGRSYLGKAEQERQNARLCRGAHADCSLYYTEGILKNPVLSNAQYVNARRLVQKNELHFRNHQNRIARNIEQLADELRRSLNRRTEPEEMVSYSGTIVPGRLWRIGRLETPGPLFEKKERRFHSDFAVDILIDASGSQRDRQSDVAMQAYMIAEALCRNQVPLQVTSFCTFWDYTVLQRFRAYEDPCEENRQILNYVTSSNNRDGLAIRAVGDSLLARPEEGRILIVLSDGKPNDIIVNRPNSRNPEAYAGAYAIHDTAYEVRKLRAAGVFVLGVFTGKESELMAEQKIFGKDFTYIRSIDGFARVVAQYLRRLLEEDGADF